MPDPKEVTKGLSDFIRQGLGLFGQGVGTVAQVLRSGDAAVREVDGALTGQRTRAAQAPLPAVGSEQEVVGQVASLVRQGKEEAARTSNPRGPGVVGRFQEVLRLLFQLPVTGESSGLSDLMPSPLDMLRMGLRDLRGSMALVRLANGAGSLADVEEVASFAEELAGRVQAGVQAVQGVAPEPPAAQAPSETLRVEHRSPQGGQVSPPPRPPRRTARRGKARGPVNPSAAAFSRAMAQEMGDTQVKRWAGELGRGRITEDQFIERWGKKVAEGNQDAEALLARAKERAVRDGLSPNDPYLEGL